MATRDTRTDTYNPVWIDNSRALKDPIRIRWDRPQRGVAGTGEPLFSAFRSCTLEIGVCTEAQFEWWHDQWMVGGARTIQMAHPDASITNPDYPAVDYVYSFSGTYFSDLNWDRQDEFYHNVRAEIIHIQV